MGSEAAAADDGAVLYRRDGAVAWITLNRPAKRNAIDLPMRFALLAAVERAAACAEVRALVLQGAGDHFCAGGDIDAMRGDGPMSTEQAIARMAPVVACARALLELPKPVIAAVDGAAYGGGLGLALCADLIVATPRARLCASFLRMGLVPDFLASFTLPRIVGWQRAKAMVYTAREMSGTEAHALGLATELAAPAELQARVAAVAQALSAVSPIAFQLAKQALLRSLSAEPALMAATELSAQSAALTTQYHRAAVDMFLAKASAPYAYPPTGS